MRKLTSILLAVAATGSVATASPSISYSERDRFERRDVDHGRFDRRDDDFGPRRYRRTWTELSQLALRDGRDSLRVHDRGTFTQLRLQAIQGGDRVRVERLIIQFADGSRQVEHLDRMLSQRDRYIDIALDGNNRRIASITVEGHARRGLLQVFGI
jgi:hypothetical protein